MATSRIFWLKINIFSNICFKRFFMFLRSFSYQTFGRRFKTNVTDCVFSDVFWVPPTQMTTYDQKFGMKMIARTWRIF